MLGWMIIVCVLQIICTAYGDIGCRNPEGVSVDWWTAIKAPLGGEYAYIDSSQTSPHKKFQYVEGADLGVTAEGPLAKTMQQIYADGVGYVLWNDQPLSKGKARIPSLHAHAKGVLGFDKNGGFYLLHSTPNFPDNPATHKYKGINDCTAPKHGDPKCGPTHGQYQDGQSYMCVSLNSENLESAAKVLRGNGLVVFAGDIASAAEDLPMVAALIDNDRRGLPKKVFGEPITSVRGEKFLLFGMAPTTPQEPVYLYEEIVEPTLKAGMKLQTFTQDLRFPTYCPGGVQQPESFTVQYSSINVEYITIGHTPLEWNCAGQGQIDHSKWGVTISSGSSAATSRRLHFSTDDNNSTVDGALIRQGDEVEVLCFADINRAGKQLERGGGALCFIDNAPMWEAYNGIITAEESCRT